MASGLSKNWAIKHHRGTMKGICATGKVAFGKYALQALEASWITTKQIEAGRRAMARYARAGGKLWVRLFPDKTVTAKPAETRMGRGKGNPKHMVSVVKPGQIIYELGGVTESVARTAFALSAQKMPIKTRFRIWH